MPEDSLSIRYVRILVDAVERRGVTRADFLRAARWEPRRLAVPEGRVPCSELLRLCELAIDLTKDAALGLHLGGTPRGEGAPLIAQLLAHAATLRSALSSMLRVYKLLDDRCRIELSETSRTVTLRYERPSGVSPRASRLLTELHIYGLYTLLRYFAPRARPTRVNFEYRAPQYVAEYERIFKGAERFEQPFTGLVFDRALMSATRMYHDEELHRAMRELADSRVLQLTHDAPYVDRVRDLLVRHEAPSTATMASVARTLNVSTRTLRRRLDAEGTTYDAVANDALAHRARSLLSVEGRTIWETALALGYSDDSAFHRAFKRWTGTTPSAFRAAATRRAPANGAERRARRSRG